MRLKKEQAENLKKSILAILPDSKTYLFGSRVDDSKKGGDIDILILGNRILNFIEKGKIETNFFKEFGEQKLDLVSLENDTKDPFKDIAMMEAIEL